MEFNTVQEVWMFWVTFGGQKGFEVRKKYANKRSGGKVRSCRYICANEGHRVPDKRDHLTKCARAETRTDCPVRIGLILDREREKYKVTDLILEHNHSLHLPETSHLMASQRKISRLQGFEVETADDAGIGPKDAHELACIQVGGSANLSYTLQASDSGRWHMVKQEVCLSIFRKKLSRTHHFSMQCRWIGKKRLQTYSGLMLKCSLTMHILVMLSVLILPLVQTRRVGLLAYLLGSIILEKRWFLVLLSCTMKHLNPSSGYLRSVS